MTAVEIAIVAQPIVAAVVGFGQVAVVAWSIRAWNADTGKRTAVKIKESQENKRRREESTATLKELIARSRAPDEAS